MRFISPAATARADTPISVSHKWKNGAVAQLTLFVVITGECVSVWLCKGIKRFSQGMLPSKRENSHITAAEALLAQLISRAAQRIALVCAPLCWFVCDVFDLIRVDFPQTPSQLEMSSDCLCTFKTQTLELLMITLSAKLKSVTVSELINVKKKKSTWVKEWQWGRNYTPILLLTFNYRLTRLFSFKHTAWRADA